MVAKLAVVVLAVILCISLVTVAAYRYWDRQADRRHEKEMAREQRDYDMIVDDIDDKLERERKR